MLLRLLFWSNIRDDLGQTLHLFSEMCCVHGGFVVGKHFEAPWWSPESWSVSICFTLHSCLGQSLLFWMIWSVVVVSLTHPAAADGAEDAPAGWALVINHPEVPEDVQSLYCYWGFGGKTCLVARFAAIPFWFFSIFSQFIMNDYRSLRLMDLLLVQRDIRADAWAVAPGREAATDQWTTVAVVVTSASFRAFNDFNAKFKARIFISVHLSRFMLPLAYWRVTAPN